MVPSGRKLIRGSVTRLAPSWSLVPVEVWRPKWVAPCHWRILSSPPAPRVWPSVPALGAAAPPAAELHPGHCNGRADELTTNSATGAPTPSMTARRRNSRRETRARLVLFVEGPEGSGLLRHELFLLKLPICEHRRRSRLTAGGYSRVMTLASHPPEPSLRSRRIMPLHGMRRAIRARDEAGEHVLARPAG